MNLLGEVLNPVLLRVSASLSPDLALANPRVNPFETGRENVSDVGEIEEEERHPENGVENCGDLALSSFWYNMTIS